MRVLIYAGSAPSREAVLGFGRPIVAHAATALTLVGTAGQRPLLQDAATRLAPPKGIPVELIAAERDPQRAILAAAARPHDLAIFGRFNRPLRRLLPGGRARSRVIAERLEPSVLRVQGEERPIRRILLASGGDHHTFRTAQGVARLAAPLGASVTLLHVLSQQSLVFERFGERRISLAQFLEGGSPEAVTLRDAAARLRSAGIAAEVRGRVGPVVDEILAELRAGDYDLLAIGAHRVASALDRLLLEDISGDLLDLSPLSTLVVKGEPAAG
jgi:nucleotide-binding universal stress UspA family protein